MGFFDKPDENAGEKELDRLFGEAAKKGAVLALLHFDAHGLTKDEVTNSMVEFLSRLTKERGVLYCRGEVEQAIERGEMYSTCSQVKMLTENFNAMLNVCLKYGPIGVEILKPSEIRLSLQEAHAVLLDASQSSQDYVNYILDKVVPAAEREKYVEKRQRRAEFGKSLLEKAQKTD